MLGLILSVIGIVAVGGLVAYAIVLTFKWLKNQIEERIRQKNAKKVAVIEMEKLIEECDNKVSLDTLKKVKNDGATHVIASVNSSNKVEDVKLFRDTSSTIDSEVDEFINRTGERMVVVEA